MSLYTGLRMLTPHLQPVYSTLLRMLACSASELAMANAQQLITKATEKCYLKCVTAPSTSLSSKEQTCLTRCMERYFEAFNIVSSTYVRRVSSERAAGAVAEAGL
ncbi:hypothetical protein BCV70DRAFT_202731 [Testicularia cyperi]|uniref:Mitochondrial import inner membrane translocase subunit n=1 Tax=Testicularia cyperi TaxID=1882483 RepID=A0A317XGT9_9BASI|nr:hypothetical protein BCV70DRAFT_202731 [Testicularia cyperi]